MEKHDSPPSINNWQLFKEKYSYKYNVSTSLMENIFIKMVQTGFINITYREEKIIVLGRNKKKRKKFEKNENKNRISNVYDIYLTIYFSKFYRYVLKET